MITTPKQQRIILKRYLAQNTLVYISLHLSGSFCIFSYSFISSFVSIAVSLTRHFQDNGDASVDVSA